MPFEPSAFRSAGRQILVYELHLTNYEDHVVRLDRIEVVDASSPDRIKIASFAPPELNAMIHLAGEPIVGDQIESGDGQRDIRAGQTAMIYLFVKSNENRPFPARLVHRLLIGRSELETASMSTRHDKVRSIGPPLKGGPWLAGSGPSNESHHRRQMLVLEGTPRIASRYAIDWMVPSTPNSVPADPRDNQSYASYGKPVLAVADATVAETRDGIPENIPGHFGKGKLAVAMSYDTFYGNLIVLDLGQGQFAYYGHLKPGSIRVKQGDHVHAGEEIGQIGDSGSSFEPHLHFEITTAAKALLGEGIPYTIEHYTVTSKDGYPDRRNAELPLDGTLVTFVN